MSNERPTASGQPGPDERTTAEATAGLPAVSARDITHAPGTMIGAYKVLETLGEGGFGVVYLAEQSQPVRRRVALKIIKPGMDSRAIVARFEAERQALALMSHPNIAKVLDAGTTPLELPGGGRPYFAMEHIKGTPITEYCDTHRLTVEQRLKLFAVVCEAVQHAHMKGIIHRDLKPSNILVTIAEGAEPRPVVIDFGVAKALAGRLGEQSIYTERGVLIGTPEYMSPEQAEMSEADIDTRSDVYSLGVLLYELLTGTVPFDSKAFRAAGIAAIQKMIRETDPPRPSTRLSALGEANAAIAAARQAALSDLAAQLRRELEWIPLKALRKDRSERYRSASELADDVRNYLAQKPLLAGPESISYRTRKFARRNRAALVMGAVLLISTAASLIFAFEMRRQRALARDYTILAAANFEEGRRNAAEAQKQASFAIDAAAFIDCATYEAEKRRVSISRQLPPAAARHLSRLPFPLAVSISHQVDDVNQVLQSLADPATGNKSVTWLHLWSTPVTDAGVMVIARTDTALKDLSWLELGGTQVTDTGVTALARADAGLRALTWLELDGTQVTDTGVASLARADTGLKSLMWLDLSGTRVTDAGILALARADSGLNALTRLNLTRTRVTDAAVEAVRARFPDIKIIR